MEEWKEYKLGEIASMKYGKLVPKNILSEGSIPIYSGYRYVGYTDKSNCSKDTIIVVARGVGGTGDVKITKEDCFLTNLSIAVNLDKDICIPYYFYYKYLLNNLKYLDSGSAQSQITIDDLKRLIVKLPNIETQCRIVKKVRVIDDKIEVNRRINEQLEELAQALFKSWFVDFEPFKDSEFEESELGMIPKGWKVGKFTDIVEIKGGGTPKTDIAEYWNGDIPFFTPKDINDVFCIDTEKNITDLGLLKCSSKLYCKNTVFITARGTVGKVCMAGRNMAMNQTCYALIGKEKYGQHFIYMQTINIVERMKKKANGAVFSAITTRDFDSEKIIIPSLDVVNDFLIKIEPLYESILHNQQEIHHLTTLRDTLLPKLMSGEIDVNEVEI